MEIYSSGNSRRKYVSPQEIQNLKNGGIKAQKINQASNAHHENIEIPEAEKMLEKNINSAYTSEEKYKNKENISSQNNTNIFQKIIDFIHSLLFSPENKNNKNQ